MYMHCLQAMVILLSVQNVRIAFRASPDKATANLLRGIQDRYGKSHLLLLAPARVLGQGLQVAAATRRSRYTLLCSQGRGGTQLWRQFSQLLLCGEAVGLLPHGMQRLLLPGCQLFSCGRGCTLTAGSLSLT